MTRHLEQYQLALLLRPVPSPDFTEDELGRLQTQHLAHYDRLRESGAVASFGPVRDQPDELLRGIVLFAVGSVEEARALAESDPMVEAGRLRIEAMTYLTAPGSLGTPGIPIDH